MEHQPRLSKAQVIARLRDHAAKHGYVSAASLYEHDRIVLRSLPLHFAGIAAARHQLRLPGPPRRAGAKTGPKPGAKPKHSKPWNAWSRDSVIEELRRLDRKGQSTTWADLMNAGYAKLISAAANHAGGLARARNLAGIKPRPRRHPKRGRWTRKTIVKEIVERSRRKLPLSSSLVPQHLVNSARRHFGNWPTALAAAGVDARAVRLPGRKYTKEEIVARMRRAAAAGSNFTDTSLAKFMKLEAVRREFGSVKAAIHAAGFGAVLSVRKSGTTKWSRERIVDRLQDLAERGVFAYNSSVHRVIQFHFGSVHPARRAAGLPSPFEAQKMSKAKLNRMIAIARANTRAERQRS